VEAVTVLLLLATVPNLQAVCAVTNAVPTTVITVAPVIGPDDGDADVTLIAAAWGWVIRKTTRINPPQITTHRPWKVNWRSLLVKSRLLSDTSTPTTEAERCGVGHDSTVEDE
jgi:hypothetical protein